MTRFKRALPALGALAIGAASLGVTAWVWQHEQRDAHERLKSAFDVGLRQSANRIEQRMASYEQMLRGVRGLFVSSGHVDREAFETYVDALVAGANFTGLQAVAYAPLLTAEHLAAHVNAQHADGAPAFTVTPPGIRPFYAPITYIAPAGSRRVLGYDPYDDPVRRAAMQQARDSGGPAITGRIRLVTEPEDGSQYGFLIMLPLYQRGKAVDSVSARRANLTGWVWAGFRSGDLMASLYGEGSPGLELQIHDGVELNDDTLIFRTGSGAAPLSPPRFVAQEYIGLAGHTWTLSVHSSPAFEQRFRQDSAHIALGAGLGVSVLLALLTYLLMTAQARAHGVARAMTFEFRQSEERYRRIVETANEGIWLVTPQGEVAFANPKLLVMLGRPADEVLGRPLAEFMADSLVDAPGVTAEGARADGAAVPGPRLRRPDGSELRVTVSTAALVDAGGEPAGTLGMVTDVTDRQHAQERREVLEAQLRESQKMEAVGTLAAGIAHDFNNILAAILGNVALTRQQLPAGHAARRCLGQIEQAGVRARSLVQKILAFSRMQPQALVNQPLRPLVEEAIALLRATLPSRVTLDPQLAAAPLCVAADATSVQQIMMNLCTNAWHALHGGSGRITIGLEPVEIGAADAEQLSAGLAPGAFAHLWVRDTGSGMDEATRGRVFEPFFTTKPVDEGTGLGLSVVHGIVTAHRGAIAVHSAPGRGSTFDIYLPLLPAPAAGLDAAGPQGSIVATASALALPASSAAPRGRGQRVMYVDDDPAMLLLVEALLQEAGYRVTPVERARDALDLLDARPGGFDLLVTDFNMPDMSGIDLAEAVARIAPGMPVVISSGYLSDELRSAASRAGVRGLLQKEYSLEKLAALVHAVLHEHVSTTEREPGSAD